MAMHGSDDNLKAWLEMTHERTRQADAQVWIPLRQRGILKQEGKPKSLGFREDFLRHLSVAISAADLVESEERPIINLSDHSTHPDFEQTPWIHASEDLFPAAGFWGFRLVAVQHLGHGLPDVWHLHQDLVMGLGLLREDDIWFCPARGREEAARLSHDDDGNPRELKIRTSYLRDFLKASKLVLFVQTYRERLTIRGAGDDLGWGVAQEAALPDGRWKAWATTVHEGSLLPFGEGVHTVHAGMTDFDDEADRPEIEFGGGSSEILSSGTSHPRGQPVCFLKAELMRTQRIEPATASTIVLGEPEPNPPTFLTRGGERETAEELDTRSSWISFRPQIALTLLELRE